MLAYRVDVTACITLGVVLLSINSIFLTIIYQLFLGGIPWSIAGFTSLGCVFGARLAPFLSRRSNPIVPRIIFATIAIGDGILFIVQYLVMHHRVPFPPLYFPRSTSPRETGACDPLRL